MSLLYQREQGTGNREQGVGNREQGTGNREQGTGNREECDRSCSRVGKGTLFVFKLPFFNYLPTLPLIIAIIIPMRYKIMGFREQEAGSREQVIRKTE